MEYNVKFTLTDNISISIEKLIKSPKYIKAMTKALAKPNKVITLNDIGGHTVILPVRNIMFFSIKEVK